MKHAGIIGLGLIGGSLARALKIKLNMKITAYSRSLEPLEQAAGDGVVDEFSNTSLSIFSDCDIIFICTPVDKIIHYVDALIPYIKSSCILTDAGSTKSSIMEKMNAYDNICFIGGHPMTGSEQTGYDASKEYLFENAFYVLTPSINTSKAQTGALLSMIKALGAIPLIMDADRHDRAVAYISHFPHILAAALVNMVKDSDDSSSYMHTLAAGGFRDMTRIASSSPEMWSSICFENTDEILHAANTFKQAVDVFCSKLKNGTYNDIYSFFDSSKQYRNSFEYKKGADVSKSFQIFADVLDRPGSIATIATLLSVNNINIKNIGIVNNREYSDGILQILFENEEGKQAAAAILKDMNYIIYE